SSQPWPSASAGSWPVKPRQRSSRYVQRPLGSVVELMTQNWSAALCIRNLLPRCGLSASPFRVLRPECHGRRDDKVYAANIYVDSLIAEPLVFLLPYLWSIPRASRKTRKITTAAHIAQPVARDVICGACS